MDSNFDLFALCTNYGQTFLNKMKTLFWYGLLCPPCPYAGTVTVKKLLRTLDDVLSQNDWK